MHLCYWAMCFPFPSFLTQQILAQFAIVASLPCAAPFAVSLGFGADLQAACVIYSAPIQVAISMGFAFKEVDVNYDLSLWPHIETEYLDDDIVPYRVLFNLWQERSHSHVKVPKMKRVP